MEKPFKIWTGYTAKSMPRHPQIFTQPSQTVPDLSLSIQEILKRYAQGQDLGGPSGIYQEENMQVPEELENWHKMDKIERIEAQREHLEKTVKLEQEIEKSEKIKRKKQHEDFIESEIKKRGEQTPPTGQTNADNEKIKKDSL